MCVRERVRDTEGVFERGEREVVRERGCVWEREGGRERG